MKERIEVYICRTTAAVTTTTGADLQSEQVYSGVEVLELWMAFWCLCIVESNDSTGTYVQPRQKGHHRTDYCDINRRVVPSSIHQDRREVRSCSGRARILVRRCHHQHLTMFIGVKLQEYKGR
jgi:hypothetical protein